MEEAMKLLCGVCQGHRRMLFREAMEPYLGNRRKKLRRKRRDKASAESTLMDPELRELEKELQSSEEETDEQAEHRMTYWQVRAQGRVVSAGGVSCGPWDCEWCALLLQALRKCYCAR